MDGLSALIGTQVDTLCPEAMKTVCYLHTTFSQGAPTAWTPFQTPLALPVQVSGTTNITAHKDPWRLQPQQAQAGKFP